MRKKVTIAVLFALLTSFAISLSGEFSSSTTLFGKLRDELDGIGIGNLLILISLSIFYYKTVDTYKNNRKAVVHVLAILFSLFMLVGMSYSANGSWSFMFGDKRQFIIALFAFGGFFALFDVSLVFAFVKMQAFNFKNIKVQWPALRHFDKHFFVLSFVIIFLCWLPYLLAYLPGSVPHDGYYQLNMAFGIDELSNHHPWLVTFIYGALMRVGLLFGSDNIAIFFTVMVLYVVQVLCYAEVCSVLRKRGNFFFGIVASIFFGIIPVFGAYAQALIKDNIFTSLFALFMIWCMELCFSTREENYKRLVFEIVRLGIVGILVCMTRNNGVYMVLPALLTLTFLLCKGTRRLAIVLFLSIAVCYTGLESFATNVLNVQEGSIREMLSIPFQQTARYVSEYEEEVTDEEKDIINSVLSYDSMVENYNPELSDPIKNKYKNSGDLKEYFRIWFSMLKKHPGVYIEATLNNTYGYYYMFYNSNVMATYQFYIKGEPVATGDFDIYYITSSEIRNIISDYAYAWREFPGLGLLVNPGFYTWVLLLLSGYLIYIKRNKQLLLFVGPALNILICIASPVNGLLRYAMPLIACAPMMVFWSLYCKKDEQFCDIKNLDCNS